MSDQDRYKTKRPGIDRTDQAVELPQLIQQRIQARKLLHTHVKVLRCAQNIFEHDEKIEMQDVHLLPLRFGLNAHDLWN